MKRRSFLKKVPILAGAPFLINGIPINVLGKGQLTQLAAANSDSDKVIVLIQLHGGNDGLNAVVPVDQYARYFSLRPKYCHPR